MPDRHRMPLRILLPALALGVAASASVGSALRAAEPVAKASDQQAQLDRGEDIYYASCVECHNSDLSGGAAHSAPPLVGPAFRTRWVGRTAQDLLDLTRLTMPSGQPKSLGDQAYRDVVAFVLARNAIAFGEAPFDEQNAGRVSMN